jgi:hypothetical protein
MVLYVVFVASILFDSATTVLDFHPGGVGERVATMHGWIISLPEGSKQVKNG